MALDFPSSPTVGQKYPQPPVSGAPVYTWDGEKWAINSTLTTSAAPATVVPLMDQPAGVVGVGTSYAREDHVHPKIYAAPFDALSFSGLQVNGSMEISQELGTGGTNVNGRYICDQWSLGNNTAAVVLAAQQNNSYVSGLRSHIFMATTTALGTLQTTDTVSLGHVIEGNRISRLGWGTPNAQPLTLAFWTIHHRAGLYSGSVRSNAGSRSYVFTYTQNVADVAEFKTVTIPGDTTGTWVTDSGVGIILALSMACGTQFTAPAANVWSSGNYVAAPGQVNAVSSTSDVLRFTGLIIVPGIEAPSAARSPLVMRPYDLELETCQRYFSMRAYFHTAVHEMFKFVGGGCYDRYQFPVQMRVIPAMSITDTANWQYITQSATWVALGSVTPGAIDDYFGAFTAGNVDADGVPKLYKQVSGATQYIKASARF